MRAGLAAGETLLVQGGSSGIGVTAIQLARALDARVIVTAGSAEKCQACLALGAHHAIDYKRQDFAAEVMRLTDQRGADVILDMVAGDYIAREIDCLAEDGRLLVIALQGGVQAGFNAARLLMKRLSIIGSTLRARPPAYKAAVARELREKVWPLLEQGRVRPVIDRVFAATDAAAAHAWMESGRHVGKIILEWK
jgi:NADPH:quinone reductase-like Zn-dependent oxidoreductase